LHVLATKIFLGGPQKCLDAIFKVQPSTDHGAKFRADWLPELRDTVAKQKKTSAVKQFRSESYRFRVDYIISGNMTKF